MTYGRDFGIKFKGNMVTFIPRGLTTGCNKGTKRGSELGEFSLLWFHMDKMGISPVSTKRFSLMCTRISFSLLLLSEKY